MKFLKKLFANNKTSESLKDQPGRTFKRIDLGRFFGCELNVNDDIRILEAKNKKIEQIKALELEPKFLRYTYHSLRKEDADNLPLSVHVAFQKEVFAEKWNMIHITEISFIVNAAEFDEFEAMSGFTLEKDFRNLTVEENEHPYEGKERRKKNRI